MAMVSWDQAHIGHGDHGHIGHGVQAMMAIGTTAISSMGFRAKLVMLATVIRAMIPVAIAVLSPLQWPSGLLFP